MISNIYWLYSKGYKLLPQAILNSIIVLSHCSLLFQIDLILNFEELLESLGIRHRFVIKESEENYPNVPATLLPEWCKIWANDYFLVHYPENHKIWTRMGKWYSKLWITDEYSTSGVKISDAIKQPPVGTSVVTFVSLHDSNHEGVVRIFVALSCEL